MYTISSASSTTGSTTDSVISSSSTSAVSSTNSTIGSTTDSRIGCSTINTISISTGSTTDCTIGSRTMAPRYLDRRARTSAHGQNSPKQHNITLNIDDTWPELWPQFQSRIATGTLGK